MYACISLGSMLMRIYVCMYVCIYEYHSPVRVIMQMRVYVQVLLFSNLAYPSAWHIVFVGYVCMTRAYYTLPHQVLLFSNFGAAIIHARMYSYVCMYSYVYVCMTIAHNSGFTVSQTWRTHQHDTLYMWGMHVWHTRITHCHIRFCCFPNLVRALSMCVYIRMYLCMCVCLTSAHYSGFAVFQTWRACQHDTLYTLICMVAVFFFLDTKDS
jgi:hypothetical protein